MGGEISRKFKLEEVAINMEEESLITNESEEQHFKIGREEFGKTEEA